MKVLVYKTSDYYILKEMEFNTLEEVFEFAKELGNGTIEGLRELVITSYLERDKTGKLNYYPAIEIYDDYRE